MALHKSTSPPRKHVRTVTPSAAGQRLDRYLAETFADQGLSRRAARRHLDAGAVYVDGHRVRVASRRLAAGAHVEIWIHDAGSTTTPSFDLTAKHVVFEDDTLIAVDKPSGLPTQATVANAVDCLDAAVRRYLAATAKNAGDTYLALHHRLDRGTSGVVLFAKARAANRGLARAFSEQNAHKVYHALTGVQGSSAPTESWTVRGFLRNERIEHRRIVRHVESEIDGARWAETELRPLQVFPGALWVEARPRTGRTHQIRVHLADSGLPVLGDRLYGLDTAQRLAAPRLMLHARSLTLEHPVTGAALYLESPLPDDFRRQVEALEVNPPQADGAR